MQSSTTHKALLEQYRALGYNCAMLNLLPTTDSVIVTEMINEIDLNIASLTSAVGHQLDIPASQQAYAQGYANFVFGHLPMETPSKERPEGERLYVHERDAYVDFETPEGWNLFCDAYYEEERHSRG